MIDTICFRWVMFAALKMPIRSKTSQQSNKQLTFGEVYEEKHFVAYNKLNNVQ